jgi:hypothetical protein
MSPEIIGAVLRHILTAVGGYFVAKGVVDQGSVEAIVGGVVASVGLAWSLLVKVKKD